MTYTGISLLIFIIVLIISGLLLIWKKAGFMRVLGFILLFIGLFMVFYLYIYPLLYIIFVGGPL
jgi:uncharacterized Tic20 family protein